jgi:site-specific recombinase XerD
MSHQLHKEYQQGRLIRLTLGISQVDSFLEMIRASFSHNTWVSYAYDLKSFVNIIDKPVLDVNTADIFTFLRHQQRSPHGRHPQNVISFEEGTRGLSRATIRRQLSTISSFYDYLVLKGEMEANPVPWGQAIRQWTRPRTSRRFLRSPNSLPQVLSQEEIDQFLGSLRTYRDRAIFLLMLLSGLRKEEVAHLQLSDIDVGQRKILVRHGKGGHQRRAFVAPEWFEVLEKYLHQERPASDSPYLFLVLKGPHRGQRLTGAGITRILRYHRTKAGVPRVRCHLLRHTCFSQLCEAGMPIEAIQEQAGHRSIEYTRRYVHLSDQRLREEYLRATACLLPDSEEGGNAR